jgi:ribonuclease P protein component
MLRKRERLSRDAFNRFFSAGKRYHTTLFQCMYSPHNTFHASVVVSKKVLRHAVDRNKLKRRTYDILRRRARAQDLSGVYICITKKPASQASYRDICASIDDLITQTTKVR